MPYRLTVEVDTDGAPVPVRSVIDFDLPPGSGDAEAITVARGIRRAFRDAYDTRVRVAGFAQTDLSRDIPLGT